MRLFKRSTAGFVVAALLIGMHSQVRAVPFAGGMGERTDPYQIATPEQLMSIGSDPNLLDKHFILLNDIDLDPNLPGRRIFDRAVIAPRPDDSGTWYLKPAFSGGFDGNGYAIRNLVVQSPGHSWAGLFGYVSGGVVKNLRVERCRITGDIFSGGVVGSNAGAIVACSSSGSVNSRYDAGGIAGHNDGLVANCRTSATVSGHYSVGGLVGSNYDGTTVNCHSMCTVTGDERVGGAAGLNRGHIANSYSNGIVTGQMYVGGLVGENWRSIDNCYSSSGIGGTKYVGGLVGYTDYGYVAGSFWDVQTSGQPMSDGGTGLSTAEMQDIQTYRDAGWDFVDRQGDGTSEIWRMPEAGGYPTIAFLDGYEPPRLQGRGTPDDPYLIGSPTDLGGMYYHDPQACYRLRASIDLSGICWSTAVIPWCGGVFEGNGQTISHLMIKGGGYLGLFGQTAFSAQIMDLGVVDVNIAGSEVSIGGLAGYNTAVVTHCYSSGTIEGQTAVGGLVGTNEHGFVAHCQNSCSVEGKQYVGGLAGLNSYGHVIGCSSSGAVHGPISSGPVHLRTGLLVQAGDGAPAAATFSSSVGGLVGCSNESDVINCCSIGEVTGASSVGGLVGRSDRDSVIDCYSAGAVQGNVWVGGLIGGGDNNHVAGCFWDTQTSGQAASAAGTGLTTAEMKDAQTYLNAGWDWAGETENGTWQAWQMKEGGDYPVLAALNGYTPPSLQGSGTSDDPYVIEDTLELGAMYHYGPDAHYRLGASIDLSGIDWDRAIIPSFRGTFDGHGETISGLTISGGWYVGLIGQLESGARVENLRIVDVNVVGSKDYVGALVGYDDGDVTGCFGSGTISGRSNVGGLVGYNNHGHVTACGADSVVSGVSRVGGLVGTNVAAVTGCYSAGAVSGGERVGGLIGYSSYYYVTDCYSTSSVRGGSYVGGLVGLNEAHLTECYGTGDVDGDSYVGGLVGHHYSYYVADCYSSGKVRGGMFVGGLIGRNEAYVANCYSTGLVSGRSYVGGLLGRDSHSDWVTGCFWNTLTSGSAASDGGMGLTTPAMQRSSTFVNAGWDFAGIWTICEDRDYPRLKWEHRDCPPN